MPDTAAAAWGEVCNGNEMGESYLHNHTCIHLDVDVVNLASVQFLAAVDNRLIDSSINLFNSYL